MLYDEIAVKANVRNREGQRVFYLGKGDTLTPSARDWLSRERVRILPAEDAKRERWRLLGGGYTEEKPEHMTHLNGEILVPKTHPRIAFRGKVDTLEAELLLAIGELTGKAASGLTEVLELARRLIRCDVLEEPVGDVKLCGLGGEELRRFSHFPQEYCGTPHFMPQPGDSRAVLLLNRCRCAVRETELAAVSAFQDRDGLPTRPDILEAMNRMSSMVYLLMLKAKK